MPGSAAVPLFLLPLAVSVCVCVLYQRLPLLRACERHLRIRPTTATAITATKPARLRLTSARLCRVVLFAAAAAAAAVRRQRQRRWHRCSIVFCLS